MMSSKRATNGVPILQKNPSCEIVWASKVWGVLWQIGTTVKPGAKQEHMPKQSWNLNVRVVAKN
jgi:hypothetical protein